MRLSSLLEMVGATQISLRYDFWLWRRVLENSGQNACRHTWYGYKTETHIIPLGCSLFIYIILEIAYMLLWISCPDAVLDACDAVPSPMKCKTPRERVEQEDTLTPR